MISGIMMAGVALIGLAHMTSLAIFFAFYLFNAIGYVFGGPLPNQVLLSRWFDKSRGRAMGFAYLGIGLGGFFVPSFRRCCRAFGWRGALRSWHPRHPAPLPLAFFLRESRRPGDSRPRRPFAPMSRSSATAFYLLMLGSMASIGAVGGTNQHLKLFLSLDLQFSQTAAASIASTVLACSIAGRLIMGWLADRIPRKHVMLLIYTLIAGRSRSLLRASPAALYAFAVIFGSGSVANT